MEATGVLVGQGLGTLTLFFQERQLREDLCRGRSVGSMSAEQDLSAKRGGPGPIRPPPGSATGIDDYPGI